MSYKKIRLLYCALLMAGIFIGLLAMLFAQFASEGIAFVLLILALAALVSAAVIDTNRSRCPHCDEHLRSYLLSGITGPKFAYCPYCGASLEEDAGAGRKRR